MLAPAVSHPVRTARAAIGTLQAPPRGADGAWQRPTGHRQLPLHGHCTAVRAAAQQLVLQAASRVVLVTGTAAQRASFLHIAKSSIQCFWQMQPDGTRKVLPPWCGICNTTKHAARRLRSTNCYDFHATARPNMMLREEKLCIQMRVETVTLLMRAIILSDGAQRHLAPERISSASSLKRSVQPTACC